LFLQKAPYFFAADGSPPLFGRSLIYRFSMLAPLVDGYREGIWPHSVGMLKRIVRKTMEFHFRVGGFDERLGKLRETFSPGGTVEVKEAYIDNGHPYWAMQGFSFLSLPKDDPFWTAEEEPLPVEKEDFATRFEGPKMLVVGTKSSGQVKWIQAKAGLRREYYRDKYIKFSYSSAFPFNVLQVKGRCPWDQTLVFRDKQSGECVGRSASTRGEVLPDGVQTHWAVQLGKLTFEVTTRLRIIGEFEERTHAITAPAAAVDRVEFLDGSYPLGLRVDEKYDRQQGPDWTSLRSDNTGLLISWKISGYDKIEVAEAFEEKNLTVNIAHPRMAVISANGNLSGKRMTLGSLHYASPKPMDHAEVLKRGGELVAAWKADA
jgi:hypothetical protein